MGTYYLTGNLDVHCSDLVTQLTLLPPCLLHAPAGCLPLPRAQGPARGHSRLQHQGVGRGSRKGWQRQGEALLLSSGLAAGSGAGPAKLADRALQASLYLTAMDHASSELGMKTVLQGLGIAVLLHQLLWSWLLATCQTRPPTPAPSCCCSLLAACRSLMRLRR